MVLKLRDAGSSAIPPDLEELLREVVDFELTLDAGDTIAVTGSPYGGRGSVLASAESALDADRIRVDPSAAFALGHYHFPHHVQLF